jgi:molybdopterin molybdotransferase
MALLPVAEALARVLAEAKPLPAEDAPLAQAHGRVLALDLVALRTQPPDDVSAMDGYAARAADVKTTPARLTLIGEVAAGRPLAGIVGPGEAARIFTGGVLPAGADTIVIQENTERDGDTVIVNAPSVPRRHVRARGLDFTKGDVLLPAGHRLSDRDLGLAAAMNHPRLGVHRVPRIAILATGDELVMPGTEPGPGEIVYSNGFALAALARHEGADVTDLGIVPDRLDATVAALRRAGELDVDVLVTTGGASVGDYDLVQQALASEGLTLSFWKIALRPGKPMMHGRLGNLQVLGLPGNPVSSYVCAVLFLVPLIRRLAGRRDEIQPLESARLGRDLPANDERADYMRATLAHAADGSLLATALGPQDSSMMSSLAKSDALIVRNPHAPAAKAGEVCAILKLAL